MSYTDEDQEVAERIGCDVVARLDELIEGESKEFRDGRRAAMAAWKEAAWHGRGEWAQMSAALHAALRAGTSRRAGTAHR